jgi:putative ATP-dependent endonuclease of the OLD family
MRAQDLAVVASTAGSTRVTAVSPDVENVQGTLRSAPVALLARRILVGEGAPEAGLVRNLCRTWDDERQAPGDPTSVTIGLATVNARGGDAALKKAVVFRELGYECAALVDNDDRNIDEIVKWANQAGVSVIRWEQGRALEDEIVQALDEDGLRDFVSIAIETRGEESVRATIANQLGVKAQAIEGMDPVSWVDDDRDLQVVARAIAAAAKGAKTPKDGQDPEFDEQRAWFKSEGGGEDLAELILRHRTKMKGTGLAKHLRELKAYIYGGGPGEGTRPS